MLSDHKYSLRNFDVDAWTQIKFIADNTKVKCTKITIIYKDN
jgi:hypothetical protein